MLEDIIKQIENDRDQLLDELTKLIGLPSADGGATFAQQMVKELLQELGMQVYEFKDIDERVLTTMDYCRPDIDYDDNAYNVIGRTAIIKNRPSLLLFAHIDTERADYFGNLTDPYHAYRKDGRLYGLGASDDKAGIMMMIAALRYFQLIYPKSPFTLTIMSILGKHGGAKGTLSALMKGFSGDYGIYLHPAETGHGFAEIKNISLGIVDFDLIIKGRPAREHDDLDMGINANLMLSHLVGHLERYNRRQRDKYLFDFGSFKGEPSYILNVGSLAGGNDYGEVAQTAILKIRVRFFSPLTIDKVAEDLNQELARIVENDELLQKGEISLRYGNFRANPAMVESEDPFVMMIKKEIAKITGCHDFIHQYHGGSDIRLPILYGNCKCIGIGPVCHLPLKGSFESEWISEDDFIDGIKILVSILYRFSQQFEK